MLIPDERDDRLVGRGKLLTGFGGAEDHQSSTRFPERTLHVQLKGS
jgi:hypothetical protein